ncbi:hypothetical protein PPTG_19920 [Phytophthora nicotianae INRA-310]|uniref:ABC-2 type transporter domain-containing protein n=1 Tax=Phytophthora nicotianae (strain INRA-310) TaxID=761204 RepID=W2PB84_PHYN3|nr:hypothetical protein PPTG_19920 [Phytophthora nicotianae INRA-310]ETM97920.1 hypothetical protein PPTG_19920 [Phytophthora nicotianae INRA-310]
MYRNRLNNIRNPGIYWIHVFMYTYLGFMVFLVFISVPLLPFFIEQRAVFAREWTTSSLSVVSYVCSKFPGHVARHLPGHSNVDSGGDTADGSQRHRTLPVEHVPAAGGVQDLIGDAAPRNIIGIAQDDVFGIIML